MLDPVTSGGWSVAPIVRRLAVAPAIVVGRPVR